LSSQKCKKEAGCFARFSASLALQYGVQHRRGKRKINPKQHRFRAAARRVLPKKIKGGLFCPLFRFLSFFLERKKQRTL
jgi:hypothetical protein